MTSKRSNRWEWSLLRLLSLAGLFLLFPVFLILSFYYVDKSAELGRVEQQVRATQFIEPALNLLRDVAYHRGLSNIYLHHTTDKRSEAQWDEITALSKKIESNVRGLEQLSALLVVEWSGKYTAIESSVGRVRDIWNELPIVQGSFSHKQVLKNFQQHSDLLQYIIILLSSLEREGDQLSALSRVILQKIPSGIPGYRARIRPIVSRITIHWPSFYNVVTGKTLALPNLIALQHIPLSPAGVIAKRPAPIALPNSCAAEWRMAPDAVFSPYASVRYFTPHMVHSQYNLL